MNKKYLIIIIALFLLVKLSTINLYETMWWDSSIYIGMGKYIYSFGNSGLWESSRPIVWPLMLGLFWKIGLNVILFGRILEIIFGSFCILLTYLIGKRIFNEKTALLASIFLAISPAFFFFNGLMLTEIVSTFFSLLGVYFFIEKKYFSSGLLLGIAFMTRLLQLFIFITIFFFGITYLHKKNKNNLLRLTIGFAAAIAPFLFLNQILYKDAFFPFLQQIFLSKNSGWHNYHGFSYYFVELFKENLLYLLSIFGVVSAFRSKDKSKALIALIFLVLFVFFSLIKQKEIRFLIILMPFMYILVSSGIVYLFDKLKNNIYKILFIVVIASSLAYSAYNTHLYYQKESLKINYYAEMESKFADANGKIWVSNPIIPVFSNKKIDKLMYYPIFSEEKKKELMKEDADWVFIDSCDLECKPNDLVCENSKIELLEHFKKNLKATYAKIGQCSQFIFQK